MMYNYAHFMIFSNVKISNACLLFSLDNFKRIHG